MHHIKTYTITIYPAENGHNVHAICHALPDCAVTGKDKRESAPAFTQHSFAASRFCG